MGTAEDLRGRLTRLRRNGSRTVTLVGLLALVALLAPMVVMSPPVSAATGDSGACKLPAPPELRHSGFPLGENFVPSTGEYRAAVLFVDFTDRPNTETTQETFARVWTTEAEDFIERQSRRQLDIVAVPHHEWLHLDTTFAATALNPTAEAVALADPAFDFSDIDAVWVVLERSAERPFGFAWTSPQERPPILTDDGGVALANGVVLGASSLSQTGALDVSDAFVAHEVLHTVGLPDLSNATDESKPWGFVGNFDPMGNLGGFANGQIGASPDVLNGGELLAWQRWQLGWFDDDQFVCAQGAEPLSATLTPLIARGGLKAAVVMLGPNRALVVEARVKDRYDRTLEREGVLVYIVDSTRFNASGSIQVQNSVAGSWPSGLDLLQPGQSLGVEGLTVDYVDRQGDDFTVNVYPRSCGGRAVTIDMNDGDSGVGTSGNDVILGTDGDDLIDGLGGDDVICAGAGADTVRGGAGSDWIRGGDGPDVIRGNAGADNLAGGAGSDRILGGIDNDVLAGEGGDDYLGGFGGNDVISGGFGADIVFGGFGADKIDGGPGEDRIRGLVGDDEINGGNGDDVIDGDRGNDVIDGGDGDDVLRGGNANDTVRGGFGDDQVSGGKGDDVVSGGAGIDVCSGNLEVVADRSGGGCEQEFGVP